MCDEINLITPILSFCYNNVIMISHGSSQKCPIAGQQTGLNVKWMVCWHSHVPVSSQCLPSQLNLSSSTQVCLQTWQLWEGWTTVAWILAFVPGTVVVTQFVVTDPELPLSKPHFTSKKVNASNVMEYFMKIYTLGARLKGCQSRREDTSGNSRTKVWVRCGMTSLWSWSSHRERGRGGRLLGNKYASYPGVHRGRQQKRDPDLKGGERFGPTAVLW